MTTYQERLKAHEARERTLKMATTYLRKAENWLYAYRSGGEVVEPTAPSTGYWSLLDQALETSLAIIEHLPDDFFRSTPVGDPFGLSSALGIDSSTKHNSSDEPLARARKVVAALEERRKAGKQAERIAALENTEGRSPEEAALYQAKAAELRARGHVA